jgi:hypothetical protein
VPKGRSGYWVYAGHPVNRNRFEILRRHTVPKGGDILVYETAILRSFQKLSDVAKVGDKIKAGITIKGQFKRRDIPTVSADAN